MELIDYLPDYPDVASETFYRDIYRKREFYSLRERRLEDFFFSHQKIISRFISHWTLYGSLMMVHDTGTGKTGSAIAVFEGLVERDPRLQTIYISKNETLLDNFRSEAVRRSPFLQKIWNRLTQKVAIDETNQNYYRNRVLREARIHTYTYARFADAFQKSRDILIRDYQKGLVILDEVHHLVIGDVSRSSTAKSGKKEAPLPEDIATIYREVHRFLHLLPRRRLLLMTATPMRYSPIEIAPLLNLMMPLNRQLPVGREFESEFFSRASRTAAVPSLEWKPGQEERFRGLIQGLISVVKQNVDVRVEFVGRVLPPMRYFRLVPGVMSDDQTKGYEEAVLRDKSDAKKKKGGFGEERRESSVYTHAVQASLLVFPNGSYGASEKSKPYFSKDKNRSLTRQFLKDAGLIHKASNDRDVLHNLERIRRMSTTYYEILRHILTKPRELVYVYCDRIQGSGIWTCVRMLVQCFDFSLVRTSRNFHWGAPRRQCIFLNDTQEGTTKTDIMNLIDIFNDEKNRYGNYIQVVFGTDKTREGITLKNIRQIHITAADWNFGKIFQAIGRGVRLLSHEALGSGVSVDIFFHCAVPGKDMTPDLLPPLDELVGVEAPEGTPEELPVETTLEEEDPLAELNEELPDTTTASSPVGEGEGDEQDDPELKAMMADLESFLEASPEAPGLVIEDRRDTFTKEQLFNSLDFYKYFRSELRDKNIKLVEYAMLTSAFDCALNIADNTRVKATDYSAECMYRPCRYRCDGVGKLVLGRGEIDDSTFNLYYNKTGIGRLVETLAAEFQERFSLDLESLLEIGRQQGFTNNQVIEALYWMMAQPVPIQYRDGRSLYVSRRGDFFFLVHDRVVATLVEDRSWLSYYARLPSFDTHEEFDRVNASLLLRRPFLEDFLSSLTEHRDEETVRLAQLLPSEVKEELLIGVLTVLNEAPKPGDAESWASWAAQHLFPGEIIEDTKTGKHVVVREDRMWELDPTTQRLRPVTAAGVVPPKSPEKSALAPHPDTATGKPVDHDDPDFIRRYVEPFRVYAFIDKGRFKIRDMRKSTEEIKDNKEKTRGKVCSSFRLSDLLYYLWRLGERFPTERPGKNGDEWDRLSALSDEELAKAVEKKASIKNEFEAAIGKTLATPDLMRFFVFFGFQGKEELCDHLQEAFKARGILAPPPIAVVKTKK